MTIGDNIDFKEVYESLMGDMDNSRVKNKNELFRKILTIINGGAFKNQQELENCNNNYFHQLIELDEQARKAGKKLPPEVRWLRDLHATKHPLIQQIAFKHFGYTQLVSNLSQRVYSITGGEAFLLVTQADKDQGIGTLIFKVSDGRYIKLRDLSIRFNPATPLSETDWIQMGSGTEKLYINRKECYNELQEHDKISQYGEPKAIYEAYKKTSQHFTNPLKVSASLDKLGKYSLAVEMDNSGKLRIVKRKIAGIGTSKLVRKETILTESPPRKIAAARLWRDTDDPDNVKELIEEIEKTQQLKDIPHVMIGKQFPAQNIQKVRMEMEPAKTTLHEIAFKDFNTVTMQQRIKYMIDAGEALEGVHERDYVNCDFKLENLLYSKAKNEALLTDFGFTVKTSQSALTGTFPAPEMPCGLQASSSKPNDCWAFGIALYAMLHGKEGVKDIVKLHFSVGTEKIKEGREVILSKLNLNNAGDLLVKELLSLNPEDRPDMKTTVTCLKEIDKNINVDPKVIAQIIKNHKGMKTQTASPVTQQVDVKQKPLKSAAAFVQEKPMNTFQRLSLMASAAHALANLHSQGKTYTDFNLENVLFDDNGRASFLSEDLIKTLDEAITKATYLSPEKLKEKTPTASRENACWAFGLALYAIMREKSAMQEIQGAAADKGLDAVMKTRDAIVAKLNKYDVVDNLIGKLLSPNAQDRKPIEDVASWLDNFLS